MRLPIRAGSAAVRNVPTAAVSSLATVNAVVVADTVAVVEPMAAGPMRSAAIAVEGIGLKRAFRQGDGEVRALDGVDIAIRAGDFVAIMGSSGSGKSTLLHLLGALDRPDAGQVLLEGRDIAMLPERELALVRRRRLGFLLQFFSLLPTMSACENVAFPLALDGVRKPAQRAIEALRGVGLGHRLDHRPGQLSGGEQQRVALARALVSKPAVLLADEPTGSLDSTGSREILELLRAAADAGQTTVVVSHDDAIRRYADHTLYLKDGALATAPVRATARASTAHTPE